MSSRPCNEPIDGVCEACDQARPICHVNSGVVLCTACCDDMCLLPPVGCDACGELHRVAPMPGPEVPE